MLGLKVTPRKLIFFPLKFFPNILGTRAINRSTLFRFDFITDLTIDKLILYFSATDTKPFVSLGKQEPP